MSSSVIKEFLVGLGFKINTTEQREFIDATTKATGQVGKLVAAIELLGVGAAAYAAVKWLDNMTDGMEKLYYASQRAGSGAGAMQAFGYAASQMGSSVEQAFASAQSFHQWMLNNPNTEALLRNNLGINSRDKDGNLLGGAEMLQTVGQKFGTLDPRLQKMYADLMGIPLELRLALQQAPEMQRYENEANRMQREAGMDPGRSAENAHKFQVQLRSLGQSFHVVGMAIADSLVGGNGTGGALERFKSMLLQHVPQITKLVREIADAAIPAIGHILDALANVNWDKAFGLITKLIDGLVLLTGGTLPDDGKRHDSPVEKGMAWGMDAVRGMWDPEARARMGGRGGNHSGDYHPDRLQGAGGGGGGSNPQALFRSLEAKFGLPSGLLDSVWNQESGRGKHMLSGAGAKGHFQFMDATARQYGLKDPNDLGQSATAAARLLANLLGVNGGDLAKALAGYNWGQGNLNKHGLEHAPKETRDYIRRIQQMMANPYGAEHARKASGAREKAGAGQTINASTTIHVNGAGDPLSVGNAVSNRQDESHKRLARNLRPIYA